MPIDRFVRDVQAAWELFRTTHGPPRQWHDRWFEIRNNRTRHVACSPWRTLIHNGLDDDAMTASCDSIESLVLRMQGDFLETPGLTLTLRSALQRFGADEITCEALLTALVDAGVLTKTQEGAYARLFPRLAPSVRTQRESGPRSGGTGRFAEHAT
jgi:hypothetical protein